MSETRISWLPSGATASPLPRFGEINLGCLFSARTTKRSRRPFGSFSGRLFGGCSMCVASKGNKKTTPVRGPPKKTHTKKTTFVNPTGQNTGEKPSPQRLDMTVQKHQLDDEKSGKQFCLLLFSREKHMSFPQKAKSQDPNGSQGKHHQLLTLIPFLPPGVPG